MTDILFKYRDFKSDFWKTIFLESGFWFSIAEKLDDEEEVRVQATPAYLENDQFYAELRNKVSILSLAKDPNNLGLWNRYANSGDGFCIEADFSLFDRPNLLRSEVEYIITSAVLPIDRSILGIASRNEQAAIDLFWKRLLFQKNKSMWGYQDEVRYMHFSADGYSNCGEFIHVDPSAFRAVWINKGKISDYNLEELRRVLEKMKTKYSVEIELKDMPPEEVN